MSDGGADAVLDRVRFDDDGLVPAVLQDATTGRVLTLAYMSRESLARTLAEGRTWLWSRSRSELWRKGATSGNTQEVRAVHLDCDGDAVLVEVDQTGVACHTGAETCFFEAVTPPAHEAYAALADLERIVADRAGAPASESYTARLLERGVDGVGKKVGEEATEVAMAAKGREREAVVRESADLLYHLVVLWRDSGVRLEEVAGELAARRTA
jgi:phosphoribosyl-ATP pyrophosphohydrolase/phosphoribosyl-AMP cyclohydrolase